MTRNKARLYSTLAAAAIACVTSHGLSYARSVPAAIGRPWYSGDLGCFALSNDAIVNTCSSTRRLDVPLMVDTSGTYTVRVNAQGATPSNNVGCEAVGSNDSTTAFWSSGQQWLPNFGNAAIISLTTYVPTNGGRLFVYCDLLPNGRVNTLNW